MVGAGPSGIAALRALVDSSSVQTITLVDPIEPGFGNAFGERCAADPHLMCNSVAGVTWIDAHRDEDFISYLVDRGWPVLWEDHMPRYLFGQYCRQRYKEACADAAEAGIQVHYVRGWVESVRRSGDGYLLTLRDRMEPLTASDVLLCTGLDVPQVPPLLKSHADHHRLIHGSYPASKLRKLPSNSKVLVIGLRSSGQDAMLALSHSGHTVVMTSPSGRLSAVRSKIRQALGRHLDANALSTLNPEDADFEEKIARIVSDAVTSAGDGLPVLEQVSLQSDQLARLRDEVALAEEGKARWADLIFDTVNALNELVSPWPEEIRRRVLPKGYNVLTRYINSLPLLYGQRLLNSINSGLVSVSSYYPECVSPDDLGWNVKWADGREERFDYILAATGFHFPRFPVDENRAIRIAHAGDIRPNERLPEITLNLRLRLSDDSEPERIWLVGAATNARNLFAHVAWVSAQQSRSIAAEIDIAAEAVV